MAAQGSRLTDAKVLIFDVYGTLADWETGLFNALQPLLQKYSGSKGWTRKEALTAFGSVETDIQAQYPTMLYSEVLAKAHEVMEERLKAQSAGISEGGSTGSTLSGDTTLESSGNGEGSSAPDAEGTNRHKKFGSSIPNWPIFPDTADALRRLSKHFKLVVLSNVDRESFRYTHALLSEGSPLETYTFPDPNPNKYWHPQETKDSKSPFTIILTAQDTGCYKPATGGFLTALDYFKEHRELFGDLGENVKDKVLSVAQSLTHDHEPANALGMKSVWIDRQSAVTCNVTPGGPQAKPKWTWRFETLGEMADAVEEEVRSRHQ